MMKDWKRHFEAKILGRGQDYYESNAVRIYDYSPEHVHAQVAGSYIYEFSDKAKLPFNIEAFNPKINLLSSP